MLYLTSFLPSIDIGSSFSWILSLNDTLGLLLQMSCLDLLVDNLMGEVTMDLIWWCICSWWSDHDVRIGVGLIVCELIDRLLLLCLMIDIRLLLHPLDHSFLLFPPSSLFSMIDTCRDLLVCLDSGLCTVSPSSSSPSYSSTSSSSLITNINIIIEWYHNRNDIVFVFTLLRLICRF